MMLGYALPIGDGQRVLWYPAPRFAWGELVGLGNKITVLSGVENLDIEDIPLLTHDNVFRPFTRMSMPRPAFYLGRLMLWGVIWLVGMDRPLEDVIGGIYLLLGLPLFLGLLGAALSDHMGNVYERFSSLFYSPVVEVVHSPRLAKLEQAIEQEGLLGALDVLDELGFQHLREFYKRAAWQTRWEVRPPTGAGGLYVQA